MNSFGRILEKHLKSHGYKKKDLAAQLEVTEAYISIICHGTQPPPTYDRCEKIADFLELPQPERVDFYKAAIESRAKKDIQVFLEQISLLSTQLDSNAPSGVYEKGMMYINESKGKQIPLIRYPKHKPEVPILKAHIIEELTLSCIVTKHVYAIQAQDTYCPEIGFNKRDIIIINPKVEGLVTGDLVLVSMFNTVNIKRVNLFSIGNVDHIEFLPSNQNERIILTMDSSEYEIFGKVVYSILSYS